MTFALNMLCPLKIQVLTPDVISVLRFLPLSANGSCWVDHKLHRRIRDEV